jgi:hypothetical protein
VGPEAFAGGRSQPLDAVVCEFVAAFKVQVFESGKSGESGEGADRAARNAAPREVVQGIRRSAQ